MNSRKIIHVDCDCFYAAVEVRDDPRLRRRPVAVGGDPSRRGVIATCNYEARAFGVRSAMTSAQALRLCPELVILPPGFDKYRRVSGEIQAIFRRYTSDIEPLSLDEAYLDVTTSQHYDNSATRIASAIRADVRKEIGITVSAGVGPNKFIAKVASDWRKPDGLFVVTPDQVEGFVRDLPVERIFGAGRVTVGKLHERGIHTCGELQALSALELTQTFGSFGERLYHLSRGEDNRPVQTSRRRKSVSVEETYARDLSRLEDCLEELPDLLRALEERFRRLDTGYVVHSLSAKMRYTDFSISTADMAGVAIDAEAFASLLEKLWHRREQPVRLLGIGLRLRDLHEGQQQQDLFPEEWRRALLLHRQGEL